MYNLVQFAQINSKLSAVTKAKMLVVKNTLDFATTQALFAVVETTKEFASYYNNSNYADFVKDFAEDFAFYYAAVNTAHLCTLAAQLQLTAENNCTQVNLTQLYNYLCVINAAFNYIV